MDTDLIELASDGSPTLHSRSTTPVDATTFVDGGEGLEDLATFADLTAKVHDLETRIERLERIRSGNQWGDDTTPGNDNEGSPIEAVQFESVDEAGVTSLDTANNGGSLEAVPPPFLWTEYERYAIPLAFLCLWLCIGMRFIFEAY
jgi:hypothetical protein